MNGKVKSIRPAKRDKALSIIRVVVTRGIAIAIGRVCECARMFESISNIMIPCSLETSSKISSTTPRLCRGDEDRDAQTCSADTYVSAAPRGSDRIVTRSCYSCVLVLPIPFPPFEIILVQYEVSRPIQFASANRLANHRGGVGTSTSASTYDSSGRVSAPHTVKDDLAKP